MPSWTISAGLAALGLVLVLVTGCRESDQLSVTNQMAGTQIAAGLLPTPTVAQATGSTDLLRPPTPVVYPTPTPVGGVPPAEPAASPATATPGEVADLAATVKAVELPVDLSASELFDYAGTALAEGDFSRAAAAYAAAADDPNALDEQQTAAARLGRAVALIEEGDITEAVGILEQLVDDPAAAASVANDQSSVRPAIVADVATFRLGQARTILGDNAGAIAAYSTYLAANPDMAAYIGPLLADAHLALGDTPAAIAALETAVDGPSQRFKAVENRLRLAGFYLAQGNTTAAIDQYDAIRDIAQTEATKGQMTYLAGQAELRAGNPDAAYERYLFGVENYPRAIETHYGLVELVNAGVEVDEYQRGIVNFFAGSYQPGIEAFQRYIISDPESYRKDSHLYLAQSFEALGNLPNAFLELEKLAEFDSSGAGFERAAMLSRAGDVPAAVDAYDRFLSEHMQNNRAAEAMWAVAKLADGESSPDAAARYVAMADAFPFDPNTPLALYRAAELSERNRQVALWQRLGEQYPANVYGAEALFRLWAIVQGGNSGLDPAVLRSQIEALVPSNYFALRTQDLVAGVAPFVAAASMVVPQDPNDGRDDAEVWLRGRLADGATALPSGPLWPLSETLAADPRRAVGEKLWQLGLFEAAKTELETVRQANAEDPLANYQMAVYFRDLGLYRSSIIAAAAVLRQTEATVFDAPLFLGRLSFPAYYADLILPLADQYGFDPRLQFALVRQESLFESFARSGAAAQGLSQVIPDTGAWIAQRLAWPDYVNEDLYKPYVGLNFGSYYLSEQLRGFDNHVHAALAAYNAGPGNSARWFQIAGGDLDLFVDTVNFPETRLYIERIYEGFNAYRHLYGLQ